MYKKAKKPLIYGDYSISTRMSFRDGRIMADVQHLPSGISSTVVFKNAQSINTSAIKMFNDGGYNPLDHFTESQVVLIKKYDAQILDATKRANIIKARQRHIPTDYEKRINIYKQQHGVLGDIENELYDSDKASKDFKNEVLINKVIRDNEHKGLRLRDAFLNKGVEPNDLNSILDKLRAFLRGACPLADENEAKEWIEKFVNGFKSQKGVQIKRMY